MKKKIIISSMLIVLIIVAVAIPKEVYQKWFNPQEPPIETQKFYQQVYLKNSQGLLVGLNVEVGSIASDQIVQKWNLLTKDAALIPSGYHSSLSEEAQLLRYEINDHVLVFHVTSEILESDGRSCLETLAWTFTDDEITEIVIKVDDLVVTEIGDFKFEKITKKMGINFNYETMFLFEASATTVVFYLEEYILPVTYFHLESDPYSYIVTKILSNVLETGNVSYQYQIADNQLVINLSTNDQINQKYFDSLAASIAVNFNFDKLVINEDSQLLYEMVYIKSS